MGKHLRNYVVGICFMFCYPTVELRFLIFGRQRHCIALNDAVPQLGLSHKL